MKVRAAPSPGRRAVTLSWGAPTGTPAKVEIYDIHGKQVAVFDNVHPGYSWDLRDTTGSRVSQGIYWIKVRTGSQFGSQKVLVLE